MTIATLQVGKAPVVVTDEATAQRASALAGELGMDVGVAHRIVEAHFFPTPDRPQRHQSDGVR